MLSLKRFDVFCKMIFSKLAGQKLIVNLGIQSSGLLYFILIEYFVVEIVLTVQFKTNMYACIIKAIFLISYSVEIGNV